MSVRSAQSITCLFTTRAFATGIGVNADSLPSGTLYVNGVANAATVTVANLDTGRYTAQVTLPTLAVGDEVEISITATVATITDKAVIWGDTKDFFAGTVPDVIAGGAGGLAIVGSNMGTTTSTIPTAAQNATAVWTDTTAGDFTTALSIGKSVMNGVSLGTGLTINILTNLPAVPTDWLTAAGVKADAVTKIQSGLSTYAGGDTSGTTTLLARIGGSITIAGGKVAATMGRTDYTGNTVQTGNVYGALVATGGTATAGGVNTITLQYALGHDNLSQRNAITITSGAGAGQTMNIKSYVDFTQVVTIDQNWVVQPDATSVYAILNTDNPAADANGAVPINGDLSATMKTSVTTAATAATPTAAGVTGNVNAFMVGIMTTLLTESVAGYLVAAFKKFFNLAVPTSTMNEITLVDTVATYTGNTPQTANVATLITTVGAAGAGLSSVPDTAGTGTLLGRLTSARAGYLDNLNVGGAVASHADIAAINQSASKHLLLTTVGQFEPGETYTVEMRTFAAADGSAVNADTTPTLTATGNVSGSLAANLGAATNPATGVYRWVYTPGATPTLEQIRFDGSATINSATFTLSAYSQTVDFATAVFTSTDQTHLTAIYNKLPTNNIADETLVLAAVGTPMQAGSQVDLVNAPNATAITAIQLGLATPTNITAGTITHLTNAPTAGDLTAAMKASAQAAADAAITANALIIEIEGETDGIAAIPTNPYTGTPPTAAAIAAAVLTDTTDTGSGIGKIIITQLGGALVSSVFTTASLANAPGGTPPTVAQIDTQLSGTHGSGQWGPGSAGSGAWTVTVTVTDGTNPLQNAWVRLTSGASSYAAITNASGIAVFQVNSATWEVVIALSGYTFTPVSLVVAANVSQPYSMTLVAITPSDPPCTTGYVTARGITGATIFTYKITNILGAGPGLSEDNAPQTATIAGSLVTFPNMLCGASYLINRGPKFGNDIVVPIPLGAGPTYQLPSLIGYP